MKLTALLALLFATQASAQYFYLFSHTPNTNGLTVGQPALFFNLTAHNNDITVKALTIGSDRAPTETFDVQIWTYAGSCLGGSATTGPTGSPLGWSPHGTVTVTQGPWHGRSEIFDIPDLHVPRFQTVGVAIVYLQGGARYNGTGAGAPDVFTDTRLTLTTGEARNRPFTTSGTWYRSRALQGWINYVVGAAAVGSVYCGPGVTNSTGSPGRIRGVGSASVATNNLTLVAENLPQNSFGFFLTSRTQGYLAQPGGSMGVLCVLGGIGRYVAPAEVRSSGSIGRFYLRIDVNRTPTPLGLTTIAAGETWNFTT